MHQSLFDLEVQAQYSRQWVAEIRGHCRPTEVFTSYRPEAAGIEWRMRLGRGLITLGRLIPGVPKPALQRQEAPTS